MKYSRKKIGLILHPYGEKESGGLGRANFSLVKSIVEQDLQNKYIIFIKGKTSLIPDITSDNWQLVSLKPGFLWLDRELYKYKEIDIFLFFTPVTPLFIKLKKIIVVVHDMGPRVLKTKNFKKYLERLLLRIVHFVVFKKADKIVAVSNFTKNQIISFYPKYKNKIEVIYNGFDIMDISQSQKPTFINSFAYFLFLGHIKDRKNPYRVLEAFEIYKESSKKNEKLIFAGKTNKKLTKKVSKSRFKKDVILAGYVNDGERAYLYKNAQALIFPSLYEGFGLPILEAMSLGTPVITSNFGAMKETAGEAALLVNPYDEKEISLAIEKVSSADYRNQLIKRGIKRSKHFSWKIAGQKYLKEIHSIL